MTQKFKYVKGEILCNYILDDNIAVSVDCNSDSITINNKIFNLSDTALCGLDRIKWAAYNKTYITVLPDTEFIYNIKMANTQNIVPEFIPQVYIPYIRNIYEDYRLCCAGPIVYDVITNVMIAILITNDYLYAYYGVLPVNSGSSRACFEAVIPLCTINDNMHDLGIGVTSGCINYYVNERLYYTVSDIGQRLADMYQMVDYGGIASSIKLQTLKLGFGSFTFLDHQLPNNYGREFVIKDRTTYRVQSGLLQLLPLSMYYEPYPNFGGYHEPVTPQSFASDQNDSNHKLWGQGITMRIESISGIYVNSKPKKLKAKFAQLYKGRRPSI